MTPQKSDILTTARISIVSLGVSDLKAATKFYQSLGWEKSAMSQESISFMKGSNIILGLYSREALAQDIGVENSSPGFSGITMALNMQSRQVVDEFIQLAKSSGAKIIKQPQEVFWGGYSGYFADLDGTSLGSRT